MLLELTYRNACCDLQEKHLELVYLDLGKVFLKGWLRIVNRLKGGSLKGGWCYCVDLCKWRSVFRYFCIDVNG